jgi:hypothetical protein
MVPLAVAHCAIRLRSPELGDERAEMPIAPSGRGLTEHHGHLLSSEAPLGGRVD